MFKLARHEPARIPLNDAHQVSSAQSKGTGGEEGGGGGGEGGRGQGGSGKKSGNLVSKSVLKVNAEYGGWIWNVDDPLGYLIYHLNSAGHYARWERELNSLPESPFLAIYHQAVAAQSGEAAVHVGDATAVANERR